MPMSGQTVLGVQRGLTFRGERIRPVFAEADTEVLRIFIARRPAWTWPATRPDRQ